jgi:hypothetical protein
MKQFLRNNGLSLCFLILFLGSWLGQIIFGLQEYNKERLEAGFNSVPLFTYLKSGHFFQATFENWESEFLQMALLVIFTIFLYQKGSSESKDINKIEEVDREPSASRKDAPWPVKKGGLLLKLYKHSLSITLVALFTLSFIIHFFGSLKDENEQLAQQGLPSESISEYLMDSRFWFESFQNWQSEFLAVFVIVLLSIYLRQIGSSQSKPVDAPHMETGNN